MTAKKQVSKKAKEAKSAKCWRFTADLPTIGLVKMGATAKEGDIKLLLLAGLRECTYLINLD
jgi:hypothetical protein